MKIAIKVDDDIRELNSQDGLPIELKIGKMPEVGFEIFTRGVFENPENVNDCASLLKYTVALRHLFLGVGNLVSNIKGLRVETTLGTISNMKGLLDWGLYYSNKNVVTYRIDSSEIHCRFHDGIISNTKKKVKNTDLLVNKNQKADLTHMICLLDSLEYRFNFAWDTSKNELIIEEYNHEREVIDSFTFEELKSLMFSDFDFIFINFCHLVISFAQNLGVFFINCEDFSREELDLFIDVIKGYYGDSEGIVFLTGVNKDNSVLRNILYLPKLEN